LPAEFEHEWRERFEEFASLSDDDAGIAGWTTTGLDARLRRFAGLFGARASGGRWLDAGCGAGTYARFLSAQGLSVVGVDYSWPSLGKARARDEGETRYLAADVRRLPFADASFDGVLCFGVLQALSESAPALAELVRVARPGGEVWIDALNAACVVHVAHRTGRRLRGRRRHLRYEWPRRLVALMRSRGLVDVRLDWMPIAPGGMPRVQRALDAPSIARAMQRAPIVGALVSHAFIVRGVRAGAT
jgi:SAM-dependent methyltransferase